MLRSGCGGPGQQINLERLQSFTSKIEAFDPADAFLVFDGFAIAGAGRLFFAQARLACVELGTEQTKDRVLISGAQQRAVDMQAGEIRLDLVAGDGAETFEGMMGVIVACRRILDGKQDAESTLRSTAQNILPVKREDPLIGELLDIKQAVERLGLSRRTGALRDGFAGRVEHLAEDFDHASIAAPVTEFNGAKFFKRPLGIGLEVIREG